MKFETLNDKNKNKKNLIKWMKFEKLNAKYQIPKKSLKENVKISISIILYSKNQIKKNWIRKNWIKKIISKIKFEIIKIRLKNDNEKRNSVLSKS